MTSSEVSTIVNTSIESGEISVSSSVIRKITRGTTKFSSSSRAITISCDITDPDKVVVILDHGATTTSSAPNVYLTSVSESGIQITEVLYQSGVTTYVSYQIIEFM